MLFFVWQEVIADYIDFHDGQTHNVDYQTDSWLLCPEQRPEDYLIANRI